MAYRKNMTGNGNKDFEKSGDCRLKMVYRKNVRIDMAEKYTPLNTTRKAKKS